jgi:Mn-dependent DtxR family transcriptional regulator
MSAQAKFTARTTPGRIAELLDVDPRAVRAVLRHLDSQGLIPAEWRATDYGNWGFTNEYHISALVKEHLGSDV